MTNLRLPGQYDERLLGTLGLQGPYYNWNRWYLPSVGRYLELDPIAKRGGFNGEYGPDWYSYAGGNPLRWIDPDGRDFWTWTHENAPWIEDINLLPGGPAATICWAKCINEVDPLQNNPFTRKNQCDGERGWGDWIVVGAGPLPKVYGYQEGASAFTSIWRYLNLASRKAVGSPLLPGPWAKNLGRATTAIALGAGVVEWGVVAACAYECSGAR